MLLLLARVEIQQSLLLLALNFAGLHRNVETFMSENWLINNHYVSGALYHIRDDQLHPQCTCWAVPPTWYAGFDSTFVQTGSKLKHSAVKKATFDLYLPSNLHRFLLYKNKGVKICFFNGCECTNPSFSNKHRIINRRIYILCKVDSSARSCFKQAPSRTAFPMMPCICSLFGARQLPTPGVVSLTFCMKCLSV